MRVVVYDPLYSGIGHFYRYNKFILEVLSQSAAVESILLICEDEKLLDLKDVSQKISVKYLSEATSNKQVLAMKAKGFQKLQVAVNAYRNYRSVVNIINASNADMAFFTSQGLLPFWISVRALKIKYTTSIIAIKWLYEQGSLKFFLYQQFKSFIKRAALNLFTEQYYQGITDRHVHTNSIVIPDRYLEPHYAYEKKALNVPLRLTTLGTISKIKSPLNFIKEWVHCDSAVVSGFRYRIAGKVMEKDLLQELELVLKNTSFVELRNDYISEQEYASALDEADFMVIPYSAEYTKFATSGVMWDCFEQRKPIICPDIEPFKFYIEKYNVGFLYKEGELNATLKTILENSESFFAGLSGRFQALAEEYTLANIAAKLENKMISSQTEGK